MWRDADSGKLHTCHLFHESTRRDNAVRLVAVRDKILGEVPGCALASDQFCRRYHLAIDCCEDVIALELDVIDCIV